MELNQIFPVVRSSKVNITAAAKEAGISRQTFYKVAKDPSRTSLARLRSIARALGYEMIITLRKIEK